MVNFKKLLRKQAANVAIIFILCGVLLFLYQQSVRVNTDKLYRMESLVDELLFLDSKVEGDMALLLAGHLAHFDTLVQSMNNMDVVRTKIDALVIDVPSLLPSLNILHDTLDKLEEPLERFKMQLSIYLNSIRYLPTLIEQVLKESPQHTKLLTNVYHEVLHLVLQTVEFDDTKINSLMEQMHAPELRPVVQHLQLLLKQNKGVEQAFYTFTHCGIDEAVNKVNVNYHRWFNHELAKADGFRFLLLWFALVLLVYVVVVLWRLHRSNDELKKSHTFLHFLQKSLDEHAVVTIANSEGDITFVNDKFCEVSGYVKDEVIGKNHRILKTDEHPPEFFTQLWATISSGETWHGVIKNKRKDGSFYWVDTTITPFLDDDGEPWQYVAVRTNITQQIATENSLKESHERYRTLSELTPFALGIVQEGKWVYINPAAIKMFGVTSEGELLNHPITDVVPDDNQQLVLKGLRQACAKQEPMPLQETKLQNNHGQAFDVELQGAPLRWNGGRAILLVMHDISERKQAEAERYLYQERLEHKQRLESLGVLAGGIAHDFNNILTSIMGNTALATVNLEAPSKLEPYLNKVSRASERAAELCQQLLMYSGGGKLEKKPVLLSDLLDDVVDMIHTTLPNNIKLDTIVAPQLPLVEVDVRQLQQVMLNLLTNAKDAITGEGNITASLGVMYVDKSYEWVNKSNIAEGDYVYFEVVDSGCGMDKATQQKMFEPFFTTKKTGRGLGMSAILGIAHSHHGALSVQSEQGQGTSIRIVLPVAHGAVLQAEDMQEEEINIQVSGKILVIDDEPGILELLEFILDDAGFEVITAKDGEEGIAQFEKHEDSLALVICDMVMPKLGGAEVANYIMQRAKDLPILLSSGYDRDSLSSVKANIAGVIQKPYKPEVLIKTVLQTLHMQ